MPWPRIHCGSSVTVSPGVRIVLLDKRGRLEEWVMGMPPSESEMVGEGEEALWLVWEGGAAGRTVKVIAEDY